MFGRTRKAAPQILIITRDWNDQVREIHWADGARVYADSRNMMVEDVWTATRMTPEHWGQVWTETQRRALVEPY